MFVDLANFTPLAEAMGDLAAVDVLERFGTIVRVANTRCHGRIVKQIGDAFMVVFSESVSAVSCALEIEDRASREPQFPPVRAGLHWGSVLYREGDYVGSNVNLASRLATDAGRHQVLVTGEMWKRARELSNTEFIRLGKRKLKGLAREVVVFEARMAGKTPSNRETDPVCGMELGPTEVAARLTWDGRGHAFCSDDCLRKFVRDPDKYNL
jgi:class 3 adenylate cyclase